MDFILYLFCIIAIIIIFVLDLVIIVIFLYFFTLLYNDFIIFINSFYPDV